MKEYQLHVFNNTQAICLWKVSTIMQKNSLKTQQKMSAILSRSKAVPTSSVNEHIVSSTENINNTAKKPDKFFPPGTVI